MIHSFAKFDILRLHIVAHHRKYMFGMKHCEKYGLMVIVFFNESFRSISNI